MGLHSCTTAPITERRQLKIIPESNLNAKAAKVYEKVKRGDVISTSGNSGISSGPHLHFEIWKDGEPVDPLLYFPELNKTDISVK